jgi:hypothetical protein
MLRVLSLFSLIICRLIERRNKADLYRLLSLLITLDSTLKTKLVINYEGAHVKCLSFLSNFKVT